MASLDRLRALQLKMAGLVEAPLATSEVPLSALAGRVLAEALHRSSPSGERGEQVLSSGTLLRPAHVPLVSSLGRSTVRVFERLRVGIMAMGCGGRAPPMKVEDDSGTTVTLLTTVHADQSSAARLCFSRCSQLCLMARKRWVRSVAYTRRGSLR